LYCFSKFTANEEANSAELFSRDVTIIPSSGEHETGSSKIKVKNVVDFSWEFRFYPGQLLALHLNGKYLAYGIKSRFDSTVPVYY
jgi:enhancer of mRNA-decapping protein 4